MTFSFEIDDEDENDDDEEDQSVCEKLRLCFQYTATCIETLSFGLFLSSVRLPGASIAQIRFVQWPAGFLSHDSPDRSCCLSSRPCRRRSAGVDVPLTPSQLKSFAYKTTPPSKQTDLKIRCKAKLIGQLHGNEVSLPLRPVQRLINTVKSVSIGQIVTIGVNLVTLAL
ncbi:ADP-ribosylation factor GTPase-activating protein 3 [Trichinella spiralis]|uniref:ADP-ribosylation factor GTPase-activating protein 3 n=1 Tax=Trichinella spiralis TaxID=6334 RepID=UPI0001EFEE26|nr:ADP-ribosylation factor GTPase-activating protein 3 [Trichinella spiralis]